MESIERDTDRMELDYIDLEGAYGGDQEKFCNLLMKMGGCAAVTACDLCLYLARQVPGASGLYPYDTSKPKWADYEQFGMEMKRHLHPRISGVSKLWMFTEGLGGYLKTRNAAIHWEELPGEAGRDEAEAFIRRHLDMGRPIPYLLLRHQEPEYVDINWHWFTLTGYQGSGEDFQVIYATYGERYRTEFTKLWNTGREEKGGMLGIRDILLPEIKSE